MNTINNSNQKLIYDKIAFTLPIPIPENKRVYLLRRIHDPIFKHQYKCVPYGFTHQGRYNNNHLLTMNDGNKVQLSMYPINKSHNFLRIEYNPTKLGKEGRKMFRRFIDQFLGRKALINIYYKAILTRVDFTLDVYDMEHNLYLYKSNIKKSEIFRGSDDSIESQVLGSDNSDCRITMYNKNVEQGISDTNNYQRLEIRFRNIRCPMISLAKKDMMSAIKEIKFYDDNFFNDKRFSDGFKEDVYSKGLNYAINQQDDNQRRNYRRYLNEYKKYPIDLQSLSMDSAHISAFKNLIHKETYYDYINTIKGNSEYMSHLKSII